MRNTSERATPRETAARSQNRSPQEPTGIQRKSKCRPAQGSRSMRPVNRQTNPRPCKRSAPTVAMHVRRRNRVYQARHARKSLVAVCCARKRPPRGTANPAVRGAVCACRLSSKQPSKNRPAPNAAGMTTRNVKVPPSSGNCSASVQVVTIQWCGGMWEQCSSLRPPTTVHHQQSQGQTSNNQGQVHRPKSRFHSKVGVWVVQSPMASTIPPQWSKRHKPGTGSIAGNQNAMPNLKVLGIESIRINKSHIFHES